MCVCVCPWVYVSEPKREEERGHSRTGGIAWIHYQLKQYSLPMLYAKAHIRAVHHIVNKGVCNIVRLICVAVRAAGHGFGCKVPCAPADSADAGRTYSEIDGQLLPVSCVCGHTGEHRRRRISGDRRAWVLPADCA